MPAAVSTVNCATPISTDVARASHRFLFMSVSADIDRPRPLRRLCAGAVNGVCRPRCAAFQPKQSRAPKGQALQLKPPDRAVKSSPRHRLNELSLETERRREKLSRRGGM